MSLKIYDKNVSLAKLVGANKDYINKQIPHLSSLLCNTIDEVVQGSEVIVVGNQAPEFSQAVHATAGRSDRHRPGAAADLRLADEGRLPRHLLVARCCGMRTLLICHEGADLDREGLARWFGSFSTFAGTVVIREPGGRLRKRIAREVKRVGWLRFLDVLAFRVYLPADAGGGRPRVGAPRTRSAARAGIPQRPDAPEIIVSSPNSAEAQAFIAAQQPDLVIARCKTLLSERIFSIPSLGTFVMHPGICPEYRNAHGCFWAMATGDRANVGMTLLRIDNGVDTGPVFGYFRVEADPAESHVVTQHRVVLDHLDAIRDKLLEIEAGTAAPIDTTGRKSAAWGQPWLTAALRLRRSAQGIDVPRHAQPGSRDERADVSRRRRRRRGRRQRISRTRRGAVQGHARHVRRAPRRHRAIPTRPHRPPRLPDPPLSSLSTTAARSAMEAADMLERHGWRGHFFVTANYIGTRGFLSEDRSASSRGAAT